MVSFRHVLVHLFIKPESDQSVAPVRRCTARTGLHYQHGARTTSNAQNTGLQVFAKSLKLQISRTDSTPRTSLAADNICLLCAVCSLQTVATCKGLCIMRVWLCSGVCRLAGWILTRMKLYFSKLGVSICIAALRVTHLSRLVCILSYI